MERMERLRWGGSSDSGSEQPAWQRWCSPGFCSGTWEEMKWSCGEPRCGKRAEMRRVFWSEEKSVTQLSIVSSRLLNSSGSTLGWLKVCWSSWWLLLSSL